MGEVYRAYDDRLQRDVAVKLLPASRAGDRDARAQLLREARAAAALNHPHLCTIYEVGEASGQVYIAMELVDGQPLDRLVPSAGLGVDQVFKYGAEIVDAVAHAHDQGVLHRDLKTANIMVTTGGHVKVLDFGLAKRLARDDIPIATTAHTLASEPGRLTGTLAYMAPEQLRNQPASAASDVWALGVVLHEMCSGRRPFDGSSGFELASAILERSPHPLPDTLPAALRAVISHALNKEPAERYQNAGELRAALDAARAGALLSSATSSSPNRSFTPTRVATVTMAAIAVAVIVFISTRMGSRWPLSTSSGPRLDSIAVLPFENLSGTPDDEYFAVGLQDGVIAELARLRGLSRVIERRSTRRFAGSTQPIKQIAASLGVDAVVTGTMVRAGDRVQVTAQLIDAATERHLWSDRFEPMTRDVLGIQSSVAKAVADAIGVDLTPEEERRWARARPVDPATYEAYLRGMHLITGGATRNDRVRGLAILQEAIDRDAGNAHAYAGFALGHVMLGHGPNAEADGWPKARAAALRALTLDPNLAEAHAALAEIRAYYEWDWAGAEQSFRRANELNPNIAMSHYHYSWYLVLFSRWDEAIAEHKRAQELDPLTPQHTAHLGTLYLWQGGRNDEAIVEAKKALDFAPNAPAAWLTLSRALANKGQHAESEAAAQKAVSINPALAEFELAMLYAEQGKTDQARRLLTKLESSPPTPWSGWSLSHLSVALGDLDGAFKWLAHRPAHAFLPWIRVSPGFQSVRRDPRFAALMNEMRLPAAP